MSLLFCIYLDRSTCLLALLSEGSLTNKLFQYAILTADSKQIKIIVIHDEDACKFPDYSEMPKNLVDIGIFDDIAIGLSDTFEAEAWQKILQRISRKTDPPSVVDIFLSHRQVTGQGIAMVLREGILKKDQTKQVFLDVKAEFDLHDLPKIVEKTRLFIFILTEGIFDSQYCLNGVYLVLFDF
jgi:hypothetical protein